MFINNQYYLNQTINFVAMIQRKQSLFLLGTAIIAIVTIFLPFQTLNTTESVWKLCLMPGCSAEIMNSNVYVPMILNFLVIALSFVTIFQFKKRVLQYKLANLVALLNVFVVGLFFLLSYTKEGANGTITFAVGAFLPILGIILAFLAAHFIKKDELLVRSADRIR